MTKVREIFRPVPMGVNASYSIGGNKVQGFLPTVAGTLTVTDADSTVLVNAIPVTAGIRLDLEFWFNTARGGTVSLAGGAAGTLLV